LVIVNVSMKTPRLLTAAALAAVATMALAAPAFAVSLPAPLPTLNFIGSIVVKVVVGAEEAIGRLQPGATTP
jgi:hypothetical protein